MPKSSPIQNAFNGGQFGPRIQGRTDLARYRTGCNELRNFLLTMQGPAVKRSGTRFVLETKDSTKKSRLIPFEFSRDQAYMLEFGDLYMRPFRDGGVVLVATTNNNSMIGVAPTAANPVVLTTANPHGLSNGTRVFVEGSLMTELNGRWFTIANVAASTYELVGEDGTGRTTGVGGTTKPAFELVMPYTEAQLFDIQVAQSQDVLYLAHPDVAPHKLERTSDTDWTITEIDFQVRPFRVENTTDVTMYVSAATGTGITLTASAATFTADMVGSWVKLGEVVPTKHPKWQAGTQLNGWTIPTWTIGDRCYYENNVYESTALGGGISGADPPVHKEGIELDKLVTWEFINSGEGWGQITAFTSTTIVTVDVDTAGREFPASVVGSGNATKKWAFGAWDDVNGYPRAVAFYEDRLWWAGTDADPQAFWGSRTGQYEDHELLGDEDDAGLLFVLASDKINAIEWLAGEDVLFVGTRGSEFTVDSGSADAAITPSNIRVRRRSSYGSAEDIQPLSVDSALLFVQKSKRRLHELTDTFDANGNQTRDAPDLTDLSYDILDAGVVELAYQASPFRQVWALVGDGTLAALTYIRDQDVIGWAPHQVGGTLPTVESIGVIPHPDGDEDQLWMIVNQAVNSAVVRYVVYLEKPFEQGDAKTSGFFVDCGLSYSAVDSVATGIITSAGVTNIFVPDGTLFTIGDKVIITDIVPADYHIPGTGSFDNDVAAAALLNGLELDVTSTGASTVQVEVSGAGVDLTSLDPSGAFIGSFNVRKMTTTIIDLDHLEGETVKVVGDGAVMADATVSGGSITLAGNGAGMVHIGCLMPSARLQTMRLDAGMEGLGTSQGRLGRIHQLVARLDQTGPGLKWATEYEGTQETLPNFIDAEQNGAVPLYTGDTESYAVPGGNEREKRVALEHDQPTPCTIVALMPQLKAEGRG